VPGYTPGVLKSRIIGGYVLDRLKACLSGNPEITFGLLQGKFGKAIKIATDQRSRIGGIIPREVFDGANMYSAVLDNDGGEFRHFRRERVRRDQAELDRVLNPATRQRPNRQWTPAEYRALLDAVIAPQPRDPATGAMIDPFTKEPLGVRYQLGHVSGREWRTVANLPQYHGLTEREIAILELNPEFYVLQSPATNQSGRFEGSPRKRAIRRRELPEGALAP